MYRVNTETEDGTLPPDKWERIFEESEEDAAVAWLRKHATKDSFPMTVHVAGKPEWPNGVPMMTRGFRFEICKDET